MYISRVEIDTDNLNYTRKMNHIAAVHSWVEDSFPLDRGIEPRPRKLWRIDKIGGKEYLLIVSETAPDLMLLQKYGIHGSAETKSYDEFLEKLKNGSRMRFRVVLNPVTAVSKGTGNRSGTKLCLTEESQREYLTDRAEKNGFSVEPGELSVVDRGSEILYRSGSKAVDLISVSYEGILTITEADTFRKMLTDGLGKHKAYGFGLMTVIPIGHE